MSAKRLLIIYYTGTGNTKRMAEAIGEGARGPEVTVEVKGVEECGLKDLVEADGIVIGSPTYFSNVAWPIKRLIDDSIALYREGHRLKDKVGGCFTSAGTHRDGKDCLRMLESAFGFHHGMRMVPGIVRAGGDRDEDVSEMCKKYGAQIALKILS